MRYPRLTILVLAIAALAATSVFAASVWKWVDKNGVTHYSDQPVTGAVRIDLLNVQTYDPEEADVPAPPAPRGRRNQDTVAAYQLVEIWKPFNEQTFTADANGQVTVAIRVDPGVQQGHSVRLELDGQRVSEPNAATLGFELKDIPRGAHTLSASIVTRDGQVVIQSTPVTFFMQQPSVLRKKN